MDHVVNFHMHCQYWCMWWNILIQSDSDPPSHLHKHTHASEIWKGFHVKTFFYLAALRISFYTFMPLNWDELRKGEIKQRSVVFLSAVSLCIFFSFSPLCQPLSWSLPLCLSDPETRSPTLNGKNSIYVKKNVICISHYKHYDSIRPQCQRCVRSV